MLDFGWSEFFLIIVLVIVLMGPKDIPEIIYNLGRMVRRLQYMKFAMSKQFDSFMEQADLQELRKGGNLGLGDVRHSLSIPPIPAQPDNKTASPVATVAADEIGAGDLDEEMLLAEDYKPLTQSQLPLDIDPPKEKDHVPS